MRSWNMQRGVVIAPQDATLHALSCSRDSRGALGGIPYVQHVRQVGITSSSDRRQDPLAVVRDQVLQLFFIRHRAGASLA